MEIYIFLSHILGTSFGCYLTTWFLLRWILQRLLLDLTSSWGGSQQRLLAHTRFAKDKQERWGQVELSWLTYSLLPCEGSINSSCSSWLTRQLCISKLSCSFYWCLFVVATIRWISMKLLQSDIKLQLPRNVALLMWRIQRLSCRCL